MKIQGKKDCVICGEEFEYEKSIKKYCSSKCRSKNNYLKNIKKEGVEKKCVYCGEFFISTWSSQKYCSDICCHRENNKRHKKTKQERKCIFCNETFIFASSGQKYCSKKCYTNANREVMKEYRKEYAKKNKDELKIKRDIYRKNNREKINKRDREARKNNPMYKLNCSISFGIRNSLKPYNLSKNGQHWEDLIMNTKEEIMEHLEKLFLPGMSRKNYGKKWHIDHIIPISFFRFTSTDDPEFKYCWSLENLQPLWEKDNLEKADKMILWGKEVNARFIDRDYFSKFAS